jgi:hypothetical protein
MPQRKYRYFPEPEADARAQPRAVGADDAFVASPVHKMHRNLWAFAENPPEASVRLYPGWIRLAVPLACSAALWGLIFWALGYVR